jgi:CspA family cold shock protein
MEQAMPQKGIVKFFNPEKGYGFIRPEDGGSDLFVHISAVSQSGLVSLEQGQVVGYELEPDKKGKGPKAVNLVLMNDS